MRSDTTAVIPAWRGRNVLPVLLGVVHQSVPPDRVIVLDCAPEERAIWSEERQLVAWACRRFGVDIVRQPVGTDATENRNRGAALADTEWLWILDDDAYPAPTALAALLDSQRSFGVGVVSGTVIDVVPDHEPWGADSWNKTRNDIVSDRLTPWCGGGATLVHRQTLLDVPNDVHMSTTIEDLVMTALVGYAYDGCAAWGCVVSARARHWHLKQTPSNFLDEPAGVGDLLEVLRPRLERVGDAFPHPPSAREYLERGATLITRHYDAEQS